MNYPLEISEYQSLFNVDIVEVFNLAEFDNVKVSDLVNAAQSILETAHLDLNDPQFSEKYFQLLRINYALIYKSISLNIQIMTGFIGLGLPRFVETLNPNERLILCFDEESGVRRYFRISIEGDNPNKAEIFNQVESICNTFDKDRLPSISQITEMLKKAKLAFKQQIEGNSINEI